MKLGGNVGCSSACATAVVGVTGTGPVGVTGTGPVGVTGTGPVGTPSSMDPDKLG
jgi:hypothetical protein